MTYATPELENRALRAELRRLNKDIRGHQALYVGRTNKINELKAINQRQKDNYIALQSDLDDLKESLSYAKEEIAKLKEQLRLATLSNEEAEKRRAHLEYLAELREKMHKANIRFLNAQIELLQEELGQYL